MQIIIVLILSFQVLWTYSLSFGWAPTDQVCPIPSQAGASNFACNACSQLGTHPHHCIQHPTLLHPIKMAAPGEGEVVPPGSPPRGAPTPAPRAIQLTVKYPTFNWDQGDPHEQFKWFKHRTEILMEGPYEDYKDPDKVAAILGWLGDKGHQIYASIDWVAMDLNKKKYKDVLKAFALYLQPMQTTMHTWYQIGNIYSSQCKDQTDFMTKLKDLSKDTGFKEPEEFVKFLFVIHNTDTKVREYLIDKGKPTQTCTELLTMARTLEGMVKTETLSQGTTRWCR